MLQSLIEECRSRGKTPPQHLPQHLHRAITAIMWRLTNGGKWRSIPPALGPWWMAAQTFIRWARLGVGGRS
ncbi:transposase [Azospirillum argentinense]|nr:transposase [Azospirillum argentinense]